MGAASTIEVALWIGVTGVALWRGPASVRLVAAAMAASLFASLALWARVDPYRLKLHLLLSDILVFAVCAAVAWKTRARWAALAAAFQMLSLLTQMAKAMDRSLLGWSYLTLGMVWGYGALASLLAGALTRRES